MLPLIGETEYKPDQDSQVPTTQAKAAEMSMMQEIRDEIKRERMQLERLIVE